jgi:hypothetical protein
MSTAIPFRDARGAQLVQPSLVDALDIVSRFEELKGLKDGWLDGAGRAPSHEGLHWLAGVLQDRCPDSLPRPYAYPVPDGGIQLEWSIQRREISLEVEFESRSGEWHSLDLNTGEEEQRELNLTDDADWSWVITRLTIAGAKP